MELCNTQDYKTCLDAIEYLRTSGIINNAAGNCIAMSDLLQHTLRELKISSRLVECKLVVQIKNNQNQTEFRYLGFNGSSLTSGFLDTHVVVVTETKIPMLIDLSISHMLPNNRVFVIERVISSETDIITKINFSECSLTYTHKKTIRLLGLHQTTLVDRIASELQTKKKLNFIYLAIIFLGMFTLFNFVMNSSMLYLRYNVTLPIIQEIKNEVTR